MDAVAIRERTPAVSNGRVRELPRDADPYMTREARAERVAWRLSHLEEWHAELENLVYFDPEYAYDVAHEYEEERTTDPDHAGNGIEFCEYDEDGVLEPFDDRRTLLEGRMLYPLRWLRGNRVESQGCLYFPGPVAERLKLPHPGRQPQQLREAGPDAVSPGVRVAGGRAPGAQRLRPARARGGAAPGAGGGDPVGVVGAAGLRGQAAAVRGAGGGRVLDLRRGRHPAHGFAVGAGGLPVGGRRALRGGAGLGAWQRDRGRVGVLGVLECGVRRARASDGGCLRSRASSGGMASRAAGGTPRPRRRTRRTASGGRPRPSARHAAGLGKGRTWPLAALHFLPSHLYSEYGDQIAAHWRDAGPPPDVMDRILKLQQAPGAWRRLLEVPDGNGET